MTEASADPFGPLETDRLAHLLAQVDRWRERPVASAGFAVLVVSIVVAGWWLGRPSAARPVEESIPFAAPVTGVGEPGVGGPGDGDGAETGGGSGPVAASSTTSPVSDDVLVHVAGAVVRPGVVALQTGDRVLDAVTAAGGPTPDADIHQLNLAAPVSDGLQITVPRMGELAPSPTGVAPLAAGPAGNGPGPPVNLNQADEAELDRLPGIGPSLAAAIVEWRNEHGAFASIDQLSDVPGIGPAKLAALADHVTV